jgi:hypothetical protein
VRVTKAMYEQHLLPELTHASVDRRAKSLRDYR